jgi:protein O-mannosyl-transferase
MAKKISPARTPQTVTPVRTQHSWYVFGTLMLLAFILYGNTLSNGFVLDDSMMITKNRYTQQGFGGISEIFSNHTFKGFFQLENQETIVEGGRFRPFSIAIFAILYQLLGATPLPYHLVNVLLYGATGWVLYRLLRYVLPGDNHRFGNIPFVASTLFLAHPVHTEVVANIKCADELWCLFFCLLSLHRSLLFHDTGQRKHLVSGALFFLLACFSKENAVTFLAVIPMAIWCFRQATPAVGSTIKLVLTHLGIFLFFLLWRGWALDWKFGNESTNVLINNPFIVWDGTQWQPMPLAQRTATIMHSLGKYLYLLVFPHPLTHDYYPRQMGISTWSDWQSWVSLFTYAALVSGLWWGWKKNKFIAFISLYFLATLSIVSNIPFSIGTNLSERFIYMPSIAFSMLVAYVLYRYTRPQLGITILALIAGLYALKTITRNGDWKDNLTLAQKDIVVSGNSAKLNNSLAAQLTEKALKTNNLEEKNQCLRQAFQCYNKALEINPTYIEAFFGRGSVHFMQNNFGATLQDYLATEKIDPNYPNLKTNLALAFRESAKIALKNNDLATAKQQLQEAQRRYPTDPETNQLLLQLNQ